MPRRLAELLAAAKLADRDVALARARAGRDSRNFATATQALQSLVPAAGQMVDAYGEQVDQDALLEAERLAAENLTATGTPDETPEALAGRLVAGSKKLQAPESKGNVVEDFLADPGGFKRRAAEKGSVAAKGKLAAQVKGNRDEAEKKGLEATKRGAEAEKLALERADGDRVRGLEAIKSRVSVGIANNRAPEQIAAEMIDVPEAASLGARDVEVEYLAQRQKQFDKAEKDDKDAAEDAREDAESKARRTRDYAAASAAREKGEKKAEAASSAGGRGGFAKEADPEAAFKIDKVEARRIRGGRLAAVDALARAQRIKAILDDPRKAAMIGKVIGNIETFKEEAGIGSEAAGIRADLARDFNDYKKFISGAAVSDKEKPDLTRVMPADIDINVDDLRRKIEAGIEHSQRQLGLADRILKSGDVRANDADVGIEAPPADEDPEEVRAAAVLYRTILSKPQQDRVNELVESGVPRVDAVRQALGGA